MSAFVGIWNRDGRPVERLLLSSLGDTMAHRAPEEQGLWIDNEVGMSARVLRVTPESASETQPTIDRFGAVLVFDGRLDNREEILASLPRSLSVPGDVPDPTLVLAAYQLHGDRLPEMLSGDFAFGLFDPQRRRIMLARDAIGMRTLYYWRGANTLVFATEIKAILAHPSVPRRPNEQMVALVAVRRFSAEPPDATFFEGISNLPPAHVAIAERECFSVRRYWDFDLSHRVRLGSFAEYVDGFRHYFGEAVRRRMRSAGPVAVSLSGGVDSSSIFCLAETIRRNAAGVPPKVLGITYVPDDGSPADETTFLKATEEKYGVQVMRVPLRPMSLLDGADEQLWHVEMPKLGFGWPTFEPLLQAARGCGARVLLDGYGGDEVLADQAYMADLVRALKLKTVWTHLRERRKWIDNAAPGAFARGFLRDLATRHLPAPVVNGIRSLLATRRRLAGVPRPDSWFSEGLLAQAFAVPAAPAPRQHSAYVESEYGWFCSAERARASEFNNKLVASRGIDVASPFMDRELLSFLFAIPGDLQSHHGVPKALLRRAMQGVLPESIAERRSKADYTDNMNQAAARELDQIDYALKTGALAERGYLRSHIVAQELARLKTELRDSIFEAARVRDLVALERWFQVFFPLATPTEERSHAARQ